MEVDLMSFSFINLSFDIIKRQYDSVNHSKVGNVLSLVRMQLVRIHTHSFHRLTQKCEESITTTMQNQIQHTHTKE